MWVLFPFLDATKDCSGPKDTVALERKHEELLRKLDFLDERITEIHQPVKMQSKVSIAYFHLRIRKLSGWRISRCLR